MLPMLFGDRQSSTPAALNSGIYIINFIFYLSYPNVFVFSFSLALVLSSMNSA